ncbi:MAG TPA: cyclic nucleotide-binding domain-containing protein, partial [Desulfosarcina sp.]|nr:cyclic nucleotide-binding domain-containing protein [Desulfosarcina sp.]
GILLDLIADERVDFRSLGAGDLAQVFRDRQIQESLVKRFHRESGANRLWTGRLLANIAIPELDAHLLAALREERDRSTRIGLIELLSSDAGRAAVDVFDELVDPEEPDVAEAMIDAGQRMSPADFARFNRRIHESDFPLAVKARSVGALYSVDPDTYGPVIARWLDSEDRERREAGIVAAGICRDRRFAGRLRSLLARPEAEETLLLILGSLHALQIEDINDLVAFRLEHDDPRMRRAALGLYQIDDEAALKNVIPLLGDDAPEVADLAREKIRSADYQNSLRLIKSLSLPQKKVQEALFDLLADMSIKDLDVFRFVQSQARECYQLTNQARCVRQLPESELQRIMAVHLDERIWFALQTTLRVLAAQDRSGRMHRIIQGILSNDRRQRANGLEAMDDILDKRLVNLLMPLLDDMSADDRISAGKRLFPNELADLSASELFASLLESRNWTTLVLALVLLRQSADELHVPARAELLVEHVSVHVATAARRLMETDPRGRSAQEDDMATPGPIPLTDKILHLKNIEIFSDLSINELAAVASATEEAAFEAGEQVFREGERGDTLYLVLEGDVAVIKDCDAEKEIELDSIGAGDYFGEMALFGDDRRSATIRVKKDSRFLTLNKQELQEIVREYPQIALHVCRVLSMRIRHLHGKVFDKSC